ncbi:MAG: hypothetical protein Q7U14_10205, partial [Lacisediminimonas sp.]|nr:hypothetical protein [Lacisediminimonas sp.]
AGLLRHAVTLEGTSNDVAAVNILSAASTRLVDANGVTIAGTVSGDFYAQAGAIRFGNLSVTGTVDVLASGSISQLAATRMLLSGGVRAAQLSAQSGATRFDITLDAADNDFSALAVTGASISLRDANNLVLTSLDGSGPATVHAAGRLDVTGVVKAQSASLYAGLDLQMAQSGLIQVSGTGATPGGGATLVAGGSIGISRIESGAGTVNISAGAAISDALAAMQSGAEVVNIVGSGTLSVSAASIGGSGDADLDVSMRVIDSLTASSGNATVTSFAGAGFDTVSLRQASVQNGSLSLEQASGNLLLTQSILAAQAAIGVRSGSLLMQDGSTIVANGDLGLQAAADIVLSSVSTNNGTLDISAGAMLQDGTAGELSNITATGAASLVRISAMGAGAAGTGQDLDVAIRLLDDLDVGSEGAYLETGRTLTINTVDVDAALHVVSQAGELILAGEQSAASLALDVRAGGLTMRDGVTLSVDGNATITARDSVTLSRLVLDSGELRLSSALGGIIDGTSADNDGFPNIAVTGSGSIGLLSAVRIGDMSVDGDIDISAARINTVNATAGDMHAELLRTTTVDRIDVAGAFRAEVSAGDLLLQTSLDAATVELDVNQGDLQLAAAARMAADGAMSLELDLGSMSMGADAQVTAASLDLTVSTGNASMDDSASMIIGGALNGFVQGNLTLSDYALMQSEGDLTMAVNQGNVTLADNAEMSSNQQLTLTIGSGDLSMTHASLLADGDMVVAIDSGDSSFSTDAEMSAAQQLTLSVGSGSVSFADRATMSS